MKTPNEETHSYLKYLNPLVFNASNHRHDLNRAQKALEQIGIANKENIDAINNHLKPSLMAYALSYLALSGILDESNRKTILAHKDLFSLGNALFSLAQSKILTQENFNLIAQKENPRKLVSELLNQDNQQILSSKFVPDSSISPDNLAVLSRAGLLTQSNLACLTKNSNIGLTQALLDLEKAEIFIQANFEIIVEHHLAFQLASALVYLHKNDVLTYAHQQVLAKHVAPYAFALALVDLKKANILNFKNTQAILQNQNIHKAFTSLSSAGILTDESLSSIIEHKKPDELAQAFVKLNEAEIFEHENIQLVTQSSNPLKLSSKICFFHQHGFTSKDALKAADHWETIEFHRSYNLLEQNNVLTRKTLRLILNTNYPLEIASSLIALNSADLLTDINCMCVVQHSNPKALGSALRYSQRAKILNQAYFELVIRHTKPDVLAQALLLLEDNQFFWGEDYELVFKNSNPYLIANELVILKQAGFLDTNNRQAIAEEHKPYDLQEILNSEKTLMSIDNICLLNHLNSLDTPETIDEFHYFKRLLDYLKPQNITSLVAFEKKLSSSNGSKLYLHNQSTSVCLGQNGIWTRLNSGAEADEFNKIPHP